jgi:hypothetical protein
VRAARKYDQEDESQRPQDENYLSYERHNAEEAPRVNDKQATVEGHDAHLDAAVRKHHEDLERKLYLKGDGSADRSASVIVVVSLPSVEFRILGRYTTADHPLLNWLEAEALAGPWLPLRLLCTSYMVSK